MMNLTIIGDRTCSTTWAYLHYLKEAGLKPQCLWLVDFHAASPLVSASRRLLGVKLANNLHRLQRIAATPTTEPFRMLCENLQRDAALPAINYFSPGDLAEWAGEVDGFSATDFHDPYLQRRMRRAADTAFLYTNGGIVPASILDDPAIRMFHIHPGIVPFVRGSDGLLWSMLVRRRVGVSCFYMNPGIDRGDLIAQAEYEPPALGALGAHLATEAGEDLAYRTLLFAVDPHFRARLFTVTMQKHAEGDLRALRATAQSHELGATYRWMHPRLRRHVMKALTR